jgi:hypothetical protein
MRSAEKHECSIDASALASCLPLWRGVSLVLSVEDEFGVMVPEAGITPSNFRSIEAISRLVDSLRAKKGGDAT